MSWIDELDGEGCYWFVFAGIQAIWENPQMHSGPQRPTKRDIQWSNENVTYDEAHVKRVMKNLNRPEFDFSDEYMKKNYESLYEKRRRAFEERKKERQAMKEEQERKTSIFQVAAVVALIVGSITVHLMQGDLDKDQLSQKSSVEDTK